MFEIRRLIFHVGDPSVVLVINPFTVLSRASAHPRASPHSSILTALWFFKVLRVTTHYAKFLRGDSNADSSELWTFESPRKNFAHVDELQAPLYPAVRFAHTGRNFVRNVLRLQYEICVLQATKAVKPWQRDFGLARFLAGYSFLYYRAGLVCLKNEARAKLYTTRVNSVAPVS